MAVKLNAAYSKKLGLPNYSSHSFAASVEVELTDINQAAAETARLYGLLQASVDQQIIQTGYLPGNGNRAGTEAAPAPNGSGNGNGNGNSSTSNNVSHNGDNGAWNCSDKQRDLILKLVNEHGLEKEAVEKTAQDRFGAGVRELNKLQASGLIAELIEVAANNRGGNKSRSRQPAAKGGGSR